MKNKFSYKSKRTIIIAAVITVLLAGTATGVYFFTKGNAQAQAAGDGNTTIEEEQYGEAPIENKGGEQANISSNNEQENIEQNQEEQQTTEGQQANQEQTTNNEQIQNNQTTTITTTGEVPNQEYVTEREETIINPWKTLTVGWVPTQFTPEILTANLTANKSDLIIAKEADKKAVETGDTITYTISIKNTGDKVAKAIIYDTIPDGTVLLDEDNKEEENTKKLSWKVTVEPGELEKIGFTVRVKATEGTIKNTAIVNGKTTNETLTGVINIITSKSSIPSTIPLHEMDKITYILTAKNSGDGDGTVKISDTVPKGTTLVKDSIKFEDKIYTEAELNEGIDVILGGNEEKTITFTVTINPFKEEKVVIRNTEAKQDGKNIPGTEDEVEKEYVSININKEFVDKDNIDKCRPLEVLFGLYTSEEANAPIKKLTLNEQNNWQGSFTKLDKYDLETKELINYYVKEIEIDKNYTPTYEFIRKGDNITFKFTNTLKYANVTTSVKVKKIWRDNEGKVGARTNVTFELYKDGKPTNITKTATEEINWQVEFSDLQKYHNDGTIIKYTVVEKTKLEHYKEPQYYNLGTEIFVINTIDYTTFYKDIKITKKWVDLKDTIHPDIEISLYQNDKLLKTDTLKSGKTEHTFENLPQYDSAGNPYIYTAQEKEIEEYNTSYSDDKLTITNTIKQDYTVKIEGTKTWEDPEGTTIVHPEITINLIKNGQQTDKKETLQNGELTYCFDNLPKYKTYDNGEYILDDDGNVQLNTYSISEENVANYDTSYNGYDIINTFNQDITGTVKITSTDNSEQSVQTPLDVVFVLDVSGSMNTNDKDKNMISAVNSAISTIMKNPDSKIGVVAFSSTEDSVHSNNANAITLLELGKYTPSTAGEYLTIEDSQYYDDYWKEYYDCDIISTNVNEKNRTSINVYGGTFTQAGIKAGANILTNATTTYTTSVNGKEKTITRTPVMILLSDGDPTYYKTDFGGLGGERKGTGRDTTENEAYYTIKTADYFKQQITSHYYDNTEKASKFYTIGLNMSGTLSQTILDPSKTNVDLCNTEGTNYNNYGLLGRNVKGKLYDKIIQDGSADKYSYADKSYVGTMTTTDLEATFNTIISENSISTEERNITLEESIARKVELKGIDTSKEFELKIGSITYNFETAQSNDYVKGNDTEGYYVDLQDIEKGTSITISYHK